MSGMIRIAAAGDIHASEPIRDRIETAFERVDSEADVVLLAGDLTTSGEPEQAEVIAAACRPLDVPIFAVLGNHDHHAGRAAELGEFKDLLDAERIVGNLHRAYLELDGGERGGPLDIARALGDIVAYNGGRPLTCHA